MYKNFELIELKQGVFAAIAKACTAAVGNAGIVDMGEYGFVFDAFLSPIAAAELKQAAMDRLGKPVKYVANSHYHIDHTGGNQVFGTSTDIIASKLTYDSMVVKNKGMIEYYQKSSTGMKEHFGALLEKEKDPKGYRQIKEQLVYIETISSPDLILRRPTITFDDEYELADTSRTIRLLNFNYAHTECDTIAYLEKEGIIFAGDLLFTGRHPWLGAGDPNGLLEALGKLKTLSFDIIVPGHGKPGTREDIILLENYIHLLQGLALKAITSEVIIESITEGDLPQPYSSWEGDKLIPNIKFLMELSKKRD